MTLTDPLILAIDQGTTSTRALAFNARGDVVAKAQKELPLITPQSGWVEQDPEQIWRDVTDVCREVFRREPIDRFIGIAITNQRETTVVWDRQTGQPVYNAIVWQDRRTADYCKTLKENEADIQARTGLLADPYFSATKIKWILNYLQGRHPRGNGDLPDSRQTSVCAEAIENNQMIPPCAGMTDDLIFGTIDSYLLWKLTNGAVHATDISNAARTMLFNIHDQQWDQVQCDRIGVPVGMLPDVMDNCADFGVTDIFGKSLPILAMAGDQQAATFGQACFKKGMMKSTYGTGCFALMNTGDTCVLSKNRLLSTIAWRIGGRTSYALEGSIFVAGAAIQFLRDNLEFFASAPDSEALALSVTDTDGVVFVPAFTGLGAPYWVPEARGAILGLSRGTTQAHIVRAVLDAQGYQTRDLTDAFAADIGFSPGTIRVDGGLATNNYVCQTIADQTDATIDRPKNTEATAWGVAAMAFLQAGVFSGFDDIAATYQLEKQFKPYSDVTMRDRCYKQWQKAIAAVREF